jgi:hypothetical protein
MEIVPLVAIDDLRGRAGLIAIRLEPQPRFRLGLGVRRGLGICLPSLAGSREMLGHLSAFYAGVEKKGVQSTYICTVGFVAEPTAVQDTPVVPRPSRRIPERIAEMN